MGSLNGWIFAGLVPLLAPSIAAAADVKAHVSVDRKAVAVGDTVTVKLEVTREGGGKIATPAVPEAVAEAFEIGRCASGTTRIGSTTQAFKETQTLSCPMLAKTTGNHKISFSVDVDGETVESNVVTVAVGTEPVIDVFDPTQQAPSKAEGDVFVWVAVDKIDAYVGEQVTFLLDVYEGRSFLEPALRTPPSFQDFFAEEIPLPESSVTQLDSSTYRVRPGMRRALFPQRAGTLTIGASEITLGRRRQIKSNAIAIEVHALPAKGQPPDFSANNVGEYSVFAEVDREDLQPGEPFTLTVVIEGEGNIGVVDPGPWPTLEGVRRYDPKTEVERTNANNKIGGKRTYSFLLIPERPGKLTIPAHTLNYFSPSTKRYATSSTDPIELIVGGDPNAVGTDEESKSPPPPVSEPLAPVIALDTVPRTLPPSRWLTQTRWTYGMLAVPLFALLGLGGGVVWRRFGPDDVARANARGRARRRALIDKAQAAVAGGEGFHAAVAALLQNVALDRAGPAGVGLPRPALLRLLEQRGVESDDLRRLENLLEQCDAARFGAAAVGAEERQTVLDEALESVRTLASGGAR